MAPLVEAFHPSQLGNRVQIKNDGKRQRPPIDLKKCELKEMIQYHCELDGPQENPKTKVVCDPILRSFRKWVPTVRNACIPCANVNLFRADARVALLLKRRHGRGCTTDEVDGGAVAVVT